MSKKFKQGLFILLIPIIAVCQTQLYSIKDLQILANENNYTEYFAHALDIKPTNRDEVWKNLTEQMGTDLLSELVSKTRINNNDYKLVHAISRWPLFKDNEFFIKKRDFIFTKQIAECFKAGRKNCLKLAEKIYNEYQHDVIFSFEFVNILKRNKVSDAKVRPYALKLAKDPISEFYCNKDEFKNVVLEYILQDRDSIIHKDCIKALKPTLEKLMLGDRKQTRQMAFKLLKLSNVLEKEKINTYHTLNFLNNSNLSEKEIDLSLKSLRYFSENYSQREALRDEILKLDPIPDKVFTENDPKKLHAKMRVLKRYFPEFLDSYTKTCLSYLNGDKEFKNGNPTPHCHELFKSKEIESNLSKTLIQKYKKATYFTR